MLDRYVVCDEETMMIVGGPYMWDPLTGPGWRPPEEGTLKLESTALAEGYAYPPPPEQPYAVASDGG